MSRAEALAADLESSYTTFATYLESLSPDQWRTPAANHPQIAAGEDERRLVEGVRLDWKVLKSEATPLKMQRGSTPQSSPLGSLALTGLSPASARNRATPCSSTSSSCTQRRPIRR